MIEQPHEARGDVDQRVPVRSAGLDEDHFEAPSAERRLASTHPAVPAPTMT
jgi:hypothetical protein